MIEKRYEFGGLDLRTKNILKEPQSASDIQNIEFDEQRNLIKRFGYDSVDTLANCLQIIPYQEGGTLIAVCSGATALYKLVSGAWEAVNWMGSGTAFTYTEALSFAEYGGVLYLADPSGTHPIVKFDGFRWYRAGIKAPDLTYTGSAGSLFSRMFLIARDCRGNSVFSDYTQLDNIVSGGGATYDREATVEGGFYYRYATYASSQYLASDVSDFVPASFPTASSDTLTVGEHNYQVGDFIPALAENFIAFPRTSFYVNLEIIAVTATTIQYDVSSIPEGHYVDCLDYSPLSTPDRSECIYGSGSSNQNFGYEVLNDVVPMDIYKTTGSVKIYEPIIFRYGALESIYDTSIVKSIPPICKYLCVYNNVMVAANEQTNSFESSSAEEISRTALSQTQKDTIYWSDLSVGGSVESFPPFNFEIIGKTEEGGISGLFASSDELTVFKQKQVYSLTGLLSLGNYRVRSMLTAGIGCLSHQSIIEANGACIFQGQRGIYIGGTGGALVELSDKIEPLFSSGTYDLTKTVIVNDVQKERFYMFIKHATVPASSILLVWDYYHKEWFKHTGINASGGLAVINDNLYHSDGSETFTRSSSYNDDGVAIEAFYATAWQDGGEPTLKKKYPGMTAINTSNTAYSLSIRQQINWTNTDVGSIPDVTFPLARDGDEDRKLYAKKVKSMRLIFQNNVLDEGLFLEGYELEITEIQKRFKGE